MDRRMAKDQLWYRGVRRYLATKLGQHNPGVASADGNTLRQKRLRGNTALGRALEHKKKYMAQVSEQPSGRASGRSSGRVPANIPANGLLQLGVAALEMRFHGDRLQV